MLRVHGTGSLGERQSLVGTIVLVVLGLGG